MPAAQQPAKPQAQTNGTGELGQISNSTSVQLDFFFFILRRSNLASEEAEYEWQFKQLLSLYMILHLLFVVDFAYLSKEFIVYCKAFRYVMKPVGSLHHSCMPC